MKAFLFSTLLIIVPAIFWGQVVPSPTPKQMADLDKVMAPLRKKVVTILESDKSGQYAKYKADLEAVAKEKNTEKQTALSDKLKTTYYAFIKKAYTTAKIDNKALQTKITTILGHSKYKLDEFGGISSESFLPLGPLPLKFDAEFAPPFQTQNEECSTNAVSICTADADPNRLRAVAFAEIDGGCRSKVSLGNKFVLPAGSFQKITIAANSGTNSIGRAFAIGGYARTDSKIGLRLQGPGVDQVIIHREAWCTAPVIWFSTYHLVTFDYTMTSIFSGNFTGGNEFIAQIYNEAHSLAVPAINACNTDCITGTLKFIKVTATN